MAYRELRGVGGWLAFLVVIMLLVTPLTAILMTAMAASAPGLSERSGGEVLLWGVTLLQAGAFAFAGWRLNRVMRPSSVTIAIATWWLAGPALTLVYAAVVAMLAGGTGDLAAFIMEIGRSALVAAAWTAYLLRSERVRNTYFGGGSPLDDSLPPRAA